MSKLPKNEPEKEKEDKNWFWPNAQNDDRRFVRVVITTKDDATIFVMLCDPSKPEFRLKNNSATVIEYYQSGDIDKSDRSTRQI